MRKVIILTGKKFEIEVIKSEKPVLVDFYASWCGPCRSMSRVLNDLAKLLGNKIKFVKIDIDDPENELLFFHYAVKETKEIPNMKLFYNGEIIREFVGYMPKEVLGIELEEELKKIRTLVGSLDVN